MPRRIGWQADVGGLGFCRERITLVPASRAAEMSRAEFSRKTKIATFDKAGGYCQECHRKLFPADRKEYDHIIPCELGGDNGPDNCQLLCGPCHAAKTATDQQTFAKARSVRAKHIGAKTTKHKIAGSKGSGFRKKMDGTVIVVKE
jgi:5-methylcytosine-specific restriction enzyme A